MLKQLLTNFHPTMLAVTAVTAVDATNKVKSNIEWGFGIAGCILALIGIGFFFLTAEDQGARERRTAIWMMIGGLIIVGIGFGISAVITPPPGTGTAQ